MVFTGCVKCVALFVSVEGLWLKELPGRWLSVSCALRYFRAIALGTHMPSTPSIALPIVP